ncbi:hypothetical protein JST97_29910 [bacterium]|nr:hypothetical protein [bacterium]
MRHFILVGILLSQLLVAGAQQLYIRNRPFKGELKRESGKTWVELKALSEALGLKLEGDLQQGYQLAPEGEVSLPGEGKVLLHAAEVPTLSGASGPLVALEDACPLLGARMVANKAMGTVDVSLVAASSGAKSVAAPSSVLGDSPYTLVEYGIPGESLTEQVKPIFEAARSEFKNVEYRFCNTSREGDRKRYARYTGSGADSTYPVAYLLDREGKVLLKLMGNHIIKDHLLPSMRKLVKFDLK